MTRSAMPATTPRSWVIQTTAIPRSSWSSATIDDLRLCRHVERGGGLVRDEHLRIAGQADGHDDALSHPAGELVRVVVEALRRRGDADLGEQLHGPLPGVLLREREVVAHPLRQLAADGVHGIERGHGILEDETDPLPRMWTSSSSPSVSRSTSTEVRGAGHPARRDRDQPGERQRRHRLARSGLAHDRQRLTARSARSPARSHWGGCGWPGSVSRLLPRSGRPGRKRRRAATAPNHA
jgi:hypothetical protein